MNMTKSDMTRKIAESCGLTQVLAGKVVETFLEEMIKSLTEKNAVSFPGFGTFKPVVRAARKGVNPLTKKPLDIPEKTSVRFSPGKDFKTRLNG